MNTDTSNRWQTTWAAVAAVAAVVGIIIGIFFSSLTFAQARESLNTSNKSLQQQIESLKIQDKQEDRFKDDYNEKYTEKEIKNFIFSFIREDESNSVLKFINYFSENTDTYLNYGKYSREQILLNRADFVRAFPERRYSSENIKINESGPEHFTAIVEFNVEIHRRNRKLYMQGLQKMEFRLSRKNNRFFIKYFRTLESPDPIPDVPAPLKG